MKRLPLFFLILCLSNTHTVGQDTFSTSYSRHKVFDSPTASLGEKFYLLGDIKIFPNGGVVSSAEYSFTPEFVLGISWGLDSLIQQGPILPFFPGILIKYVLSKESYYAPAFALGFDNRPNSRLLDKESRHYFKSKGLFAVASKYYLFLGYPLGLHGGINYSILDNKQEKYGYLTEDQQHLKGKNDFLNGHIALDKQIWEPITTLLEYDLALDDNLSYNPFRGYFNIGFIIHIAATQIEFSIKDVFSQKKLYNGNGSYRPGVSREIRVFFRKEL